MVSDDFADCGDSHAKLGSGAAVSSDRSAQDRFWQSPQDCGGRISGTPGPHRDSQRRLVAPPEPLEEAGQLEEIGHAEGEANHGDSPRGPKRWMQPGH
jgi:hypothetical protein